MAPTLFKLRPLPGNGTGLLDQAAFHVHISKQELSNLGLDKGGVIRLSTSRGFVGLALASLDYQTGTGNRPLAKVTDALREKYQLDLKDQVEIQRIDEPKCQLTSITVSFQSSLETPSKFPSDVLELSTRAALAGLDIILPGCVFDLQERPRPSTGPASKLRMTITSIESDYNDTQPLFFHIRLSNLILRDVSSLEEPRVRENVTFHINGDGIGGLSKVISTINQDLELMQYIPWSNPSRFLNLTTFLIHGPEGCGKTLLLRRLSEAAWSKVYWIDKSWFATNRRNQADALSDIFKSALAHQPSLIVLDQLDIWMPKDHDLGEFLNNQIKATRNHKVVVAAAARYFHDVHPKLRYFTVFNKQLQVTIPNVEEREDILRQMLGPESTAGLDLKKLAANCHGFVGNDFDQLCTKVRPQCPNETKKASGNPEHEALVTLKQGDLEAIIKDIEPTALKDGILKLPHVPKVHWSDIAGVEDARRKLESIFVHPFKHPELDILFNSSEARRGVLLYGPPGCAKTMIAKAVATEVQHNFLAIKGSELITKYVGDSEHRIRDVFQQASAAKPCILFFDEFDSIGLSRSNQENGGLNVVTTLLNEMDGIEALKDVFIIAATNRPDVLDPALLRSGRFDVHIHMGLPNLKVRQSILGIHTKDWPLAQDVDLASVASKIDGYSGADIKGLCNEVVAFAKDEYLQSQLRVEVGMRHFNLAMEKFHSATLPEVVRGYERWRPGMSLAWA